MVSPRYYLLNLLDRKGFVQSSSLNLISSATPYILYDDPNYESFLNLATTVTPPPPPRPPVGRVTV